jgi:hypothetical protein
MKEHGRPTGRSPPVGRRLLSMLGRYHGRATRTPRTRRRRSCLARNPGVLLVPSMPDMPITLALGLSRRGGGWPVGRDARPTANPSDRNRGTSFILIMACIASGRGRIQAWGSSTDGRIPSSGMHPLHGVEEHRGDAGSTWWADWPGISARTEDGHSHRPMKRDTAIARGSRARRRRRSQPVPHPWVDVGTDQDDRSLVECDLDSRAAGSRAGGG